MPDPMKDEPTITARQRLAEISHHFLDDNDKDSYCRDEEKQKSHQLPYKLAIVTPPYSSFPHYMLAEFLAELSISTDIIDERDFKPCRTQFRPSHSTATSQEIKTPDIQLILPGKPRKQAKKHCHTLLIPVTASKAGMRHAFICAKEYLGNLSANCIGISAIDATDKQAAQRCYKTLAIAVQQFLSHLPASYGHFESDQPENQMTGIAELVQQDLEQWQEKQTRTSIRSLINNEDNHEHSYY